jgi:Mrp family chromosome partitioning ATPase
MAITRNKKNDSEGNMREIKSVVSQDMKCDFICEYCERFFDCDRPERARIYERRRMVNAKKALANIKYKILVAGGKGGVGKSTCSANLATGMALMGFKTTILDQDLDGSSIPKMLGVMEKRMQISENGLIPVEGPLGMHVVAMANLKEAGDAVVWFHEMRRNASEEFICHTDYGSRDFLIVDLPPGTSSDNISVLQLIPDADGYIVVTASTKVSQATARKAILLGKKAGKRILGIIENMSGYICEHCGKEDDLLPLGGGYDLAREQDVPFLGRIPLDPSVASSCDEGKPLVEALQGSALAGIIDDILMNILAQLQSKKQYGFNDIAELRSLAGDKNLIISQLKGKEE